MQHCAVSALFKLLAQGCMGSALRFSADIYWLALVVRF